MKKILCLICLCVLSFLVTNGSAETIFSDDFTFDGANNTPIPAGFGQKWAPVIADPNSRDAYARYYSNKLVVGLESSYTTNERLNCVLSTQESLPLYWSIQQGVNPVTSLDMVSDGQTNGTADSTACWTRVVFRFSEDTYIEMQYFDDARWSGTTFVDKGGPRIWVYKDGSSTYVRSHTYDGFYPESIHFDFTLTETDFILHATTANGGADGNTSEEFDLSIAHGLDLATVGDPKLELGFREPAAQGYVGVSSFFDNVVVTGEKETPAAPIMFSDDFTFDGANFTAIPTGVGQKWAPVFADPNYRGAYARYYNNQLNMGLDSSYSTNDKLNCVLSTQNAIPYYGSIRRGVNPVTSLDMVSDGQTNGTADSTACWTRVVFRFSEDTYIEMQYIDDAKWSGSTFVDKGGPRIWVYKDGSSTYVRSHTYDGYYPESIHFEFTLTETELSLYATTENGGADGNTSEEFDLSITHGLDLSMLPNPKLELGFREPSAQGATGVSSFFDNVMVTGIKEVDPDNPASVLADLFRDGFAEGRPGDLSKWNAADVVDKPSDSYDENYFDFTAGTPGIAFISYPGELRLKSAPVGDPVVGKITRIETAQGTNVSESIDINGQVTFSVDIPYMNWSSSNMAYKGYANRAGAILKFDDDNYVRMEYRPYFSAEYCGRVYFWVFSNGNWVYDATYRLTPATGVGNWAMEPMRLTATINDTDLVLSAYDIEDQLTVTHTHPAHGWDIDNLPDPTVLLYDTHLNYDYEPFVHFDNVAITGYQVVDDCATAVGLGYKLDEDLNGDCTVDMKDVAELGSKWLDSL